MGLLSKGGGGLLSKGGTYFRDYGIIHLLLNFFVLYSVLSRLCLLLQMLKKCFHKNKKKVTFQQFHLISHHFHDLYKLMDQMAWQVEKL